MAPPLVLIVDDEPDFHDLLRYVVEDTLHARALFASNADEALALIATQNPDLVLLDLVLPGTGGLELCRLLKASSTTRQTPVIAVTGAPWGFEETHRRAIEAGFNSVVHKLYNFHQLEPIVSSYLDAASPKARVLL